jgi:diguanylate cyclase (GGDEF)-like protein/putative nucleotidyltransferase with HDIG domain
MVYQVEDVTERKLRDEALLNAMTKDGLTGACSRTYLNLDRPRLEAEANLPVSLILCDVDGLKLINDVYGHEEGDALLRDVAQVLMEAARPQDLVVRYGGDEFLLLLPRTGPEEADGVSEQIQRAFQSRAEKAEAAPRYSSISIGCATRTGANQPLSDVIRATEEILFTRKLLAKKSIHNAILSSIKATLYEKSNETEEHCERMAHWARALGEATGLSGEPLDLLELGAYLHDIGKVRIDSSILKKPGKLSASEWEEIKKHPEAGYRIASSVPELQSVADLILCHHEKWDGSGYPRSLAGEEIPPLARIIALVDAYDAMTTDRSYQRAMTKDEAIQEIRRCAGSHFDRRVAEIFIEKVL